MNEKRKTTRRKFHYNCKFMIFDKRKHLSPYCSIDKKLCTSEKYFNCSHYKWLYEKDEKRKKKDRRKY